MYTLTLSIKTLHYSENKKIDTSIHFEQHKELFEVLQFMEPMNLSLTYFWSGDSDQMLQLYLTLLAHDENEAKNVMVFLNRSFESISLDYEVNRQDELDKYLSSFSHTALMDSKNINKNFLERKPVLYNVPEMSARLSHWNESWLLRIELQTLSVKNEKLLAEQKVIDKFNTLSSPMLLQVNEHNKTHEVIPESGKLLQYSVEFYSDSPMNQRNLMILRQGFGDKLWHSYKEKINGEYKKDKDEIDSDSLKTYSKKLNETTIPASKAHYLFQIPKINHPYSYLPVDNSPQLAPPSNISQDGINIGVVDGLLGERPVCVESESLTKHMYVVGKTGTGKSSTLRTMVSSLIEKGDQAVFLLDPHGDLADDVLRTVSPEHADRIVYIDFANTDYFPGINVFSAKNDQAISYAISQLDLFFLRMYGPEIWGPRISDAFRNLAQILANDIDAPGTIIDLIWAVNLDNNLIRKRFEKQANVKNNLMLKIFMDQVMKKAKGDGSFEELTSYFRAKFSPIVDSKWLRNIFGQQKNTIDFKKLATEKKIVLFNLNKGVLSSRHAELLGTIITTQLFQLALSNAEVRPEYRIPMALVADEFQNYMSDSVADILSEARKFRLSLILANQYLSQTNSNTRQVGQQQPLLDAILGNVETLASFRLSNSDARILVNELGSEITAEQLSSLPNYQAVCRMSQKSLFNFKTLPFVETASETQTKRIIKRSIKKYCRPRDEVEQEITHRLERRLGLVKTSENSVATFRH